MRSKKAGPGPQGPLPHAGARDGMTTSVSSRSTKDRTCRAEENLQVEHERPVVDVPEVKAQGLLPGEVAAAADLPEAGEPRSHAQAPDRVRFVAGDLARQRRTRPDEGHLALENVDQLRQLVH